jgi:hypothetical protein
VKLDSKLLASPRFQQGEEAKAFSVIELMVVDDFVFTHFETSVETILKEKID